MIIRSVRRGFQGMSDISLFQAVVSAGVVTPSDSIWFNLISAFGATVLSAILSVEDDARGAS